MLTAARIATLTAAFAAFAKVMNIPRGQIVNKSALLREVETDTAALVQLATDMDDLTLQYDGTDAGNPPGQDMNLFVVEVFLWLVNEKRRS